MHRKRTREDADLLETATHQSIRIAQSLGEVGGSVWDAVREQLQQSTTAITTYRENATKLQEELLTRSVDQSKTELTCLTLSRDLKRGSDTQRILSQHLTQSSAIAASSVTSHIDESVRQTFDLMHVQMAAERDGNVSLTNSVSALAYATSTSLQETSQQLLDAKLDVTKAQLALKRMTAKYEAERQRHRGAAEEVDQLMRMTRYLAERSKSMEATNKELARAKMHVRRLEQQLSVHEIAKAIAGPSKNDDHTGSSVSVHGPCSYATPEYYAFREIQRKNLTLSELVESWCTQRERLEQNERREKELEAKFSQLQQQILTVHHQFLEERKRNEMLERRLAEMARERLLPNADAGLVAELHKLRQKYSESQNEKAELKVTVCVTSAELSSARHSIDSLSKQVVQLTQDADGDHVTQTLVELRKWYTSKVDELQRSLEHSEYQRLVYLSHSDACTALVHQLEKAYAQAQENAARLSSVLEFQFPSKDPLHSSVLQMGETARKSTETLRETLSLLGASVVPARLGAGSIPVVSQLKDAAEFLKSTSLELARVASNHTVTPDRTPDSAAEKKAMEGMTIMEKVVREALRFVVAELSKSDLERKSLLETSLSDSERLAALSTSLANALRKNNTLQQKLFQSNELIEMNHLTILEHARMQKITAEDSLEAAEATEQLSRLRDEMDTLNLAFKKAQEELADSRTREEDLKDLLHREQTAKKLLEAQMSQWKSHMTRTKEMEATAVARYTESEARFSEMLSTINTSSPAETWGNNRLSSSLDSLDIQKQFTEQLHRVAFSVQKALQEANAALSVKESESELLYKGYGHVITLLRQVCGELGLLQHVGNTLSSSVGEATKATPDQKLLCEECQSSKENQYLLMVEVEKKTTEIEQQKKREKSMLALLEKLNQRLQENQQALANGADVRSSSNTIGDSGSGKESESKSEADQGK